MTRHEPSTGLPVGERPGLLSPTSLRALIGVLGAALTLRLGVVTVGPLIERIRHDTGMSSAYAGMLGTIPFLCMGVFAFVGIPLLRRLGARRLIGASLVLIGVGTLARASAPTAALMVGATVPLGIGIALAGMALPAVVKQHFPHRPGAATGAYVAALSVGAAVGALLVVPIANALDSWRWPLALSAIPSVAALPLWLLAPRVRGARAPRTVSAGSPRASLRTSVRPPPLALLLALIFGAQSMCFAAVINWVAALYTETGWTESAAALATAVVPIVTVPASLIVPGLSDGGDRRLWIAGSSAFMTVGMFGLAFVPDTVPWLWIVSFAAGAGSIFPLSLTLPLDLAESEHDITRLAAWMLGLGYGLSAAGPVIVGALRDLTGGFVLAFATLGAIGMTAGIAGMHPALRPARGLHRRPSAAIDPPVP